MAKGNAAAASSPAPISTPALKKSTSSTQNMKNQKTLLGFFQKTPNACSSPSTLPERSADTSRTKSTLQSKPFARANSSSITPAPSSDAFGEDEDITGQAIAKESSQPKRGLPSPVSSANGDSVGQTVSDAEELTAFGTPSRKVSCVTLPFGFQLLTLCQAAKKMLSYAESESEGADSVDDDVFKPAPKKKAARPSKRRKVSESADEDVYEDENNGVDDGTLLLLKLLCPG
jgi:DNA mismatch repair protein MSH6